jgi:hypothetical protein
MLSKSSIIISTDSKKICSYRFDTKNGFQRLFFWHFAVWALLKDKKDSMKCIFDSWISLGNKSILFQEQPRSQEMYRLHRPSEGLEEFSSFANRIQEFSTSSGTFTSTMEQWQERMTKDPLVRISIILRSPSNLPRMD